MDVNGQTLIVFLILLMAVLFAGYKLFRLLKGNKAGKTPCDDCACKTFCRKN
ncbi:MAG: FeoB-associated Cys-rich membrane protein [Dysgonamonadaceae bacterium]|nr:FeoB-associated Cys-rich membrane protein [Dysgonamonadaceae bacterium]